MLMMPLAADERVVRQEEGEYLEDRLSAIGGTVILTNRRLAFEKRASLLSRRRVLIDIPRKNIRLARAGAYPNARNVLVVETADGRAHTMLLRSNVIDWLKATRS